ncbi:PREDICTED: tripartite motif-containing protein 7-like [Gekko japonicus]|uniref:RING-type E3 ubiquitin transferase n=1 Tax=Gekko japonicus TaxID=146911 RepID=A0ABM1LCH7_GEKJA|nr:PREDICTED: tripartite motif-containing protein 7-like [Gekko japonicus]
MTKTRTYSVDAIVIFKKNFSRVIVLRSGMGVPEGSCLTRSWGESGAKSSCPQCRRRTQKRKLRPSHRAQLVNTVEIAKKFALQEGKDAGANGQLCPMHQALLRFSGKDEEAALCVVCGKEAVVAARKGGVCQKHQEPLKLFCKDDEALICVVCDRSKEHRDHETLPLEEASQEYKDQFCSRLEILKEERERILAYKGDVLRQSLDLLKQTTGEKHKTVAKFRQLHTFLEEHEKRLLAQMEEVKKEVARNREQHLARLSEELSSLESLIREMEEKSQLPAGDLLQDIQSTLQRYEEKETFENPVTFPLALKWRIWDVCDINHFLDGVMKQLKDTLDSGLHLQKAAKVILDPYTAHPKLILSEGWKSVRRGENVQALPHNPERFDHWGIVLGREGFTGGCHFWEVLVGSEEEWAVGVARKSVRRKGGVTISPEEGIWGAGKWWGSYRASEKDHAPPLTLSGELKRIRVCLNHTGGRVAFFDADQAALLYEFSGASFLGETLLPFFWVHSEGHLKISS